MKSFLFCGLFAAFVLFAGLTPDVNANGGRLRAARFSGCGCNGAAQLSSGCHGAVEVRAPFVRVFAPLRRTARLVTAPVRRVRAARVVVDEPACYAEPAQQVIEYYRAPARVERLETECYEAPARLESQCYSAPAQLQRSRIIQRY